ncbi:MAG: tRNA (adenosine(37)-N6)-dimethylallyltransferase MiaA [Anaeroplasmataceae bacterium]|nr:tRNA (adenosine(37)-N6)-dimethylallyltransferase MiaA [Anaeroplasmataceae bacterium]
MKPKVIVVVGPTAVGKTKISIALAKHYHTDIISGDSIAIYKGLDIGSAKPSIEEQDGIKHHLIDILDVTEDYSVADFQKSARKFIEEKPLSIICGGTGLYIQACLFNYEFKAPKRDEGFKEQFANYSNEELYDYLKSLDPSINSDRIHPNNRKRVLRALEVLLNTGKSINEFDRKEEAMYDYFIVYLTMDRAILYDRISKRVDQMISSGLIEEAKTLYDKGIYLKGIGYQELYPYFEGNISLESAIEEIKKNTRHLAKRQETWFKNQMKSHFFNVNLENIDETLERIKKEIDGWIK